MREIVHIRHDIVGIVGELLEAEFEDSEGDFLVLAAVVFHEGSGVIHVELCSVGWNIITINNNKIQIIKYKSN